jgi:predicted Rossmann fold nucleotide-binding protein DprA/Smf involved in DNA uptake
MNISSQTQAVMLLTVSLVKSNKSDAKPLSTKEWASFAVWLKDHDLEPSALIRGNVKTLLSGWMDRSITLTRLENLLNRGGALGLALEKWERAGLWVITRSDPEYPERLKRRLRLKSPPVLFGCGNKMLLDRGGIAVVGSRDADQRDIAFSENLGDAVATQGYSVVSGGARGVDESTMLGALRNDGTAIGVVANNLLRTVSSAKYRKFLISGDLVLITPFNPEAGFNVGNAMSRNRYIYCLSDAAVVVSSTPNKGGTWSGALEDLKAEWVPLWVKRTESTKSGNSELVEKGANWIPDDLTSLDCLMNSAPSSADKDERTDVPLLEIEAAPSVATEPIVGIPAPLSLDSKPAEEQTEKSSIHELIDDTTTDQVEVDFYTLFLTRVHDMAKVDPMRVEDIALNLELETSQVKTWLKRAVDDGKIRKLMRPVRYLAIERVRTQASLFGEEI